MASVRRATARFEDVRPVRKEDGSVGVELAFRPEGSRTVTERIDDYAELGPELTVPAVEGLGKVLRILRAARIAAPREPAALAGRLEDTTALLGRALGTALRLELRPRFQLRFLAWTEHGVVTVEDVLEVRELEDAFYVHERDGRFPLRFARDAVIRQRTESERWHEVVGIERA